MSFNSSFDLARRPVSTGAELSSDPPLREGHADLLPGHRYLFDIRKDYYDSDLWWKKGRKKDVLDLPGQDRGGYEADGKPVVLGLDEPIEFKVLPLDD